MAPLPMCDEDRPWRFGIVGVSQLPLLYLLASKRLSPFVALHASHEVINRWHRTLGYITYFLISLHGAFYLNRYYQVGELGHAILRTVPALGIVGLLALTLLTTTTLAPIRHYSYRIFYATHILVASALPFIIWFHVPHGRMFMIESFCVLVADSVARRLNTVTTSATISSVPGTNLVKIVTDLPPAKLKSFGSHPALHAYLGIPLASWGSQNWFSFSSLLSRFASNPFTIASVDMKASRITLIARVRQGPFTNRLASLALQSAETRAMLSVEGPYGAAAHFPDFRPAEFGRILLVAGGVGATFVMPLYEHITTVNPSARVELVWAVRNAAEATWSTSTMMAKSVQEDERVHMFVTGTETPRTVLDNVDDVEMSHLEMGSALPANIPAEKSQRPDLQVFVDNLFSSDCDSRAAVIVCGPTLMAQKLRRAVDIWVQMGEDVWFHHESLGW
ncbi:hypothetical protein MBLNU459_g0408t1 [Dothideomycetes sp. NU459]